MLELGLHQGGESILDLYGTTADATPTAIATPGSVSLAVSSLTAPNGVAARWKATIPGALTDSPGEISVTWSWQESSVNRTRKFYFDVVEPYVYPISAAERLGFSTDPQSIGYRSIEEIVAAERIARYTIDAYTGVEFGSSNGTVTVTGQGNDTLVVDKYIRSVSRIWKNDRLVYDPAAIVPLNEFGYPIIITETGVSISIEAEGVNLYESELQTLSTIRRSPRGGHQADAGRRAAFVNGASYKIEGSFGFQSIPVVITECAIMLINDFLCSDSTWRRKYISDMRTQDWSIKYSAEVNRGTGNAIVDDLLDEYRQSHIVII
jgi:hypothetical protein